MLKTGLRIVLVVAAVASAVAVGVAVRTDIVEKRRSEAARTFEAVIADVAAQDAVVVAVDAAVASETTTATAQDVSRLIEQSGPAAHALAAAFERLEEAERYLDATRRGRAEVLKRGITGRIEMLETGSEILAVDAAASAALDSAQAGWALLLDADAHEAVSIAQSNLHTDEGARAAAVENDIVFDLLTQAAARFASVRSAFPSQQADRVIAYVEARLASNTLARQADDALAAGDVEGANRSIGEFNEAELATVELAQGLPSDPRVLVKEAYDEHIGELLDRYSDARQATAAADDLLRS